MSAELVLPAERRSLRPSWAAAARFVLPATILVTLIAELLLAERKYALFGGGFGQSQVLDAPLEIGAFLAAILACQTFVFWLLYRALRRLHGRAGSAPLFVLNYLFLVGGGAIAMLIGKYQALAFFSDAMSFQIVRNLGGGSLVDALLYSLSESGLMLIALTGAAVFYVAALIVSRRWRRNAAPIPDCYRIGGPRVLVLLAATALLLFAVNRVDDARAAAGRFNAVLGLSTLFDQLTDFDRDGWSWFSYPLDCQPFDTARHPFALDIPGDGIDQDGFGGDFAFSGDAATAAPPIIAGTKRNVVLIVLESTRADAIGRRVDGRSLTPTLDALAASGSRARAAYSHVGFTTFSLQSLFTGELAPVDDRQSLIRDFQANGYEVGVFSGQDENFGGTAELVGLRRASTYVDGATLREERAFSFAAQGSIIIDGKLLLREFDRRLGRPEAWRRPQFLYFNLQSAHFPYTEPLMDQVIAGTPIPRGEIGAANRDWTQRTYWNAIAYNDRLIGALIARLRRLGVLDNTLLIVTADHGESLFDDGFLGHGHMLNEQQTRIPFILSAPGVAMPPVMGLADMRGLILTAAGAPQPERAPVPVFQYLGSLDRPGSIGSVDPAGNRTVFNLFEESVWTSGSARWVRYSALAAGSGEKRAADALIGEWARQRWLRHLREQPAAR
jgi:phosphoglycerol transferase MdoB-like AlkP superfamily enzyme